MTPESIVLLTVGALAAGFVSGFTGFGTGMTASGFWLLALPASAVPPLIVLTGMVGQLMGVHRLRKSFEWSHAMPYVIGGVCTIGFGVVALSYASPSLTKITIGALLIVFSTVQLSPLRNFTIRTWGGKAADTAAGAGAGFMTGFAGLPAPIPLIWLGLRGGPSSQQRMIYQPLNLVLITVTAFAMMIAGHFTQTVLLAAVICLPTTAVGAWVGLRMYSAASEKRFRKIVTALLFVAGVVLIFQSLGEIQTG